MTQGRGGGKGPSVQVTMPFVTCCDAQGLPPAGVQPQELPQSLPLDLLSLEVAFSPELRSRCLDCAWSGWRDLQRPCLSGLQWLLG